MMETPKEPLARIWNEDGASGIATGANHPEPVTDLREERRIKVPKKVGKCRYCNDPIYDFQEIKVINGKKYHEGCYKIMKREQPTSE